MNSRKIFTEYHHTPISFNRHGKSKGQVGIEECINKYAGLSLKTKYYAKKYIVHAIADKNFFTEKELKNYLMSLRRQRLLTEKQANDIFDLSMGILPKQEDAVSKAPELNESKPKIQIKTPRYEKLMQEMKDKAALRMESYKNMNKPGRAHGKADDSSADSNDMSRGKSAEDGNNLGKGINNKSDDIDKFDELLHEKFVGKIKPARLPRKNIPLPRIGNN